MKRTFLTLAGFVLAPMLFAAPAKAGDYCREYTRQIYVGNHIEQGYGKACQRPNGDWEIVSSSPGVDPYAILPPELQGHVVRYYTSYAPPPQRVIVTPAYNAYYRRPAYYRPSSTIFSLNFGNSHTWERNDHRWDRNDHGGHDDHHDDHHGNWHH